MFFWLFQNQLSITSNQRWWFFMLLYSITNCVCQVSCFQLNYICTKDRLLFFKLFVFQFFKGKYKPWIPSEHWNIHVLKQKVLLTGALCKTYNIKPTNFKHNYNSSEDVARDFNRFVAIFRKRKGKTITQYCNDVRDIWRSVDPLLCIHPSQLTVTEIMESKYFLA